MPRPAPALEIPPRKRWKLLVMSRRQWAEIELPFACWLLKTVTEEAPLLAEEKGFASSDQFLTDYVDLGKSIAIYC